MNMRFTFKMMAFSINTFLTTRYHLLRSSYSSAQVKRNGSVNKHNFMYSTEDNQSYITVKKAVILPDEKV